MHKTIEVYWMSIREGEIQEKIYEKLTNCSENSKIVLEKLRYEDSKYEVQQRR